MTDHETRAQGPADCDEIDPTIDYGAVSADDEDYVFADMSDLERQPLLIPRFDILYKKKMQGGPETSGQKETVHLDGEERRAMIRGALTAGLLVAGVLVAAFAGLIILIGLVWG